MRTRFQAALAVVGVFAAATPSWASSLREIETQITQQAKTIPGANAHQIGDFVASTVGRWQVQDKTSGSQYLPSETVDGKAVLGLVIDYAPHGKSKLITVVVHRLPPGPEAVYGDVDGTPVVATLTAEDLP